jgi:hypothetical protein
MPFQPGKSFSFTDGGDNIPDMPPIPRNMDGHLGRIHSSVQQVAKRIGEFYLEKNGEDYDETAAELLRLQITKIEVEGDTVTITTNRPGMLIGNHAANIDGLSEFIEKKIKIIECRDNIYNYLISIEEDERDDYDRACDRYAAEREAELYDRECDRNED